MATPTTRKPRAKKAEAPSASQLLSRDFPAPEPAPAAASNHPVLTDPKLIAMAEEYCKGAPEKNRLEKRLKELKPVLLAAMGDADMAYAGKRVLTRAEVVGTPDTVGEKITKAMVGQHLPGKKGQAGYTTLVVR
jgi:hypothetical protein